ncbi:MAG TPA: tol-pal system protein YbgF [Rhizomicrobium sp.]|nr:tol-pal system protein YbgF [Rhizomicrobium sp.]
MTQAGTRILGACSVALCALVIASAAVGASGGAAPAAHYIEPSNGDGGRFIRVAGLFGESDEEKAARLQHEADQDGQISRLNDKVRDLEDSVRNLTGTNEELSHRIGELNDKIDRQQKDFEYRLCALAAQQLGTATGQGDPNAVPCPGSVAPSGGGSSSFNAPPPALSGTAETQLGDSRGGAAPQRLAPPPGVLGTLPAGADSAPPPRSTGSGDDTRAQFSTAMELLAKARYDEASAAFRSFADANPKDDLASQAVYWVADIAYVQKDYAGAARGFAEVIKKYPTSLRAPDSMLKLGQALIAAGQKKEGCTALAALPAKYPKAAKALLVQGADAHKATCRGIS